jgi:rhodanese-related sulfurtransferase
MPRMQPTPAPACEIERMTPRELDRARRGGEAPVVLDVRRRDAWATEPARIPGAVWVPLDEVPQRARDLPAGVRHVVYCS